MNQEDQNTQVPQSFYERPDTEDYNKYMQNMDTAIARLVYKLQGKQLVLDSNTRQYKIKKSAEPMMNDQGINYIEGYLSSTLTPNLYMAKMDDGQAKRYIVGTKQQMGIIINRNRINWGITIDNIRPIISLLCSLIAYAITKSKTDKEFLSETVKAAYSNASRDGQRAEAMQNFGF